MNYRNEIKKMLSRVPQKVRDGALQQAIAWKAAREKAEAIARKSRASEGELLSAYASLSRFE